MSVNQFDDGLELIFNGICFFLENNQVRFFFFYNSIDRHDE